MDRDSLLQQMFHSASPGNLCHVPPERPNARGIAEGGRDPTAREQGNHITEQLCLNKDRLSQYILQLPSHQGLVPPPALHPPYTKRHCHAWPDFIARPLVPPIQHSLSQPLCDRRDCPILKPGPLVLTHRTTVALRPPPRARSVHVKSKPHLSESVLHTALTPFGVIFKHH